MSRTFIWFIAIKYHSFLINQKSPHFCWMHLGTIDHRWWALMFMASLMWDINEPLRKPEEFNLDFVLPAGKIMLRFDSVIFYASPSWGSNKRRRGCWDIVLDGRTNYWILNRGKGRGGGHFFVIGRETGNNAPPRRTVIYVQISLGHSSAKKWPLTRLFMYIITHVHLWHTIS